MALTDITDVALESLDALAADWGIELSIDGVRKRASAPNGSAPAQARFLEWLRKEKPEVLAGGKFA